MLMRMMYIDGGKELVRLLKAVHELGVAVSVDMAMFEESTEAGAQDWNEVLKSVIPYIDFLLYRVLRNFVLCWIVTVIMNGMKERRS